MSARHLIKVEQLAKYSDCRIIVANQTQLSPSDELCNDLITIVQSFCINLSYSKSLKKN